MPLFRRRQSRLDKATADGLAEAYAARFDRRNTRPIVACENNGLWTVLLPDALAVQRRDGWELVGWHEIDRGGWNSQNGELRWELTDGRRGSVLLEQPGRVPEVFAERVAASIVVQQHLDIEGTREGAVVSARRDLGDRSAPLLWRTRRGRGTPDSDEVRELLGAETRRLRSDYDI